MNRVSHGTTWVLFALLAYFIAANILSHWLRLPNVDDTIFVPLFTLFSLLHCGAMLGPRRTALFFALTVVISYMVEETGVRTGLVFGRYHYSDMLGPKLGNVPVLIPLGWFMMIYPSWVVARALLSGIDVRRPAGMAALALAAALAMTGWDMVMDPPMAAAGVWVWEDGGPYFGVPLHNFVGWAANTFVIYLAFNALNETVANNRESFRFGGVYAALPVLLYVVFSFQYLSPSRQPPLILIAMFSMALPGLLALARVALPKSPETL